jgi:hypothetical protein
MTELDGICQHSHLLQASESLAGRIEIVNLMLISRAEILGKEPTFLKMAFLEDGIQQQVGEARTELNRRSARFLA